MGALQLRDPQLHLQAQRQLQRCGAPSRLVVRNMKQRPAAIDTVLHLGGGNQICARRSAVLFLSSAHCYAHASAARINRRFEITSRSALLGV
jgi:hypothetical protein